MRALSARLRAPIRVSSSSGFGLRLFLSDGLLASGQDRLARVKAASADAMRAGGFAAVRAGRDRELLDAIATGEAAHVAAAARDFFLRNCHGVLLTKLLDSTAPK